MVVKKTSSCGRVRSARSEERAFHLGSACLPNRVFLAPLSGISDVPFRRLARRFGAGLVYSEMVASGEFLKGSRDSLLRAMSDGAGLHAVQLAGRDPDRMGRAAAILADSGADLIDINFGCPAKKVVGGLSGSALMREPDLALRIVEATVAGAGNVPVTVKMRLGWDCGSINAPELAAEAEAAGVRMVTVHGRTRQQFYEGSADWRAIGAVRAAVSIPVVANGDLVDRSSYDAMREASGCDAVMIGRGAQGRPWFTGLIAGVMTEERLAQVRLDELASEHLEMMMELYGPLAGLRQARKHLGWYADRAAGALGMPSAAIKAELLRLNCAATVVRRLRAVFAGLSAFDIEATAPAVRKEAA